MKKRVLLFTRPIIPPWDEASKNLAYEIACNCDPKGCDFCVLSTKNAKLPIGRLSENNILLEKIFSSASLGLREKLQLLLRLYRLPLKADIIHFLFTPRSITSWLIKLRLLFSNIKTLQTVATISDELYQNPQKLASIFFADVIIAQSNYTKNNLLKSGFKNVNFIYPGINLETFKPTPKASILLKELNINPTDVVFLFAGELTRIKGIDDIIEAFNILKNKKGSSLNTTYKLVIACRIKSERDKEKRHLLEKKIKSLKMEKEILFYDQVKDMSALYNISDVQIFYVNEMTGKVDIPYVIIEPMACAKPVLLSDLPVLKEILNEEKNGLAIEKSNPKALAEAILTMIENPEKREKMGQNALNFIRNNFDIRKNVKQYEELYNNL